ncbi:flavodoxin or tryptophan repressor binding protein [Acinetobacter haemolyticus]|nr:flavodoxin or tryptophan repressor binding protein [Acinetobacter haemolyticus]
MFVLDSATPKVKVCVVYHSPYGHTAKVAQYIAQGAEQARAEVHVLSVAAVQ